MVKEQLVNGIHVEILFNIDDALSDIVTSDVQRELVRKYAQYWRTLTRRATKKEYQTGYARAMKDVASGFPKPAEGIIMMIDTWIINKAAGRVKLTVDFRNVK